MVRATWQLVRENTPIVRILAADLTSQGLLRDQYRGADVEGFFAIAIEALGTRLGMPPELARVRHQAMVVLLARFGITENSELVAILGVPLDDVDSAVEQHLIDMAKILLLPGS
tara:strand:- start:25365 stop:25706 length:342 start_codon:yes stop_codon:yes gene_type:complete